MSTTSKILSSQQLQVRPICRKLKEKSINKNSTLWKAPQKKKKKNQDPLDDSNVEQIGDVAFLLGKLIRFQ